MSRVQSANKHDDDNLATRVYLDYAKHYAAAPTNLDASFKFFIPVDAGQVVLGVRAVVETAFTGTAPTVSIGDAAAADGFLLTTDLDLTALGALANSQKMGHNITDVWTPNAYTEGKAYLAATGLIVLTFNELPTAGLLGVDVIYRGYGAAERGEVA